MPDLGFSRIRVVVQKALVVMIIPWRAKKTLELPPSPQTPTGLDEACLLP
jgi:hypothetical protein